MALKTCFISALALTKMDTPDINEYLENHGFDIRYHYMTTTTDKGIEFVQFLDKGSRLSLKNEHVDFHALMGHVDKQGLNATGIEG